jgi:hypothetical protein
LWEDRHQAGVKCQSLLKFQQQLCLSFPATCSVLAETSRFSKLRPPLLAESLVELLAEASAAWKL